MHHFAWENVLICIVIIFLYKIMDFFYFYDFFLNEFLTRNIQKSFIELKL